MIYLDNNATTLVDQIAVNAMQPYFQTLYGNPSSMHAFGESASQDILGVKQLIAQKLCCSEDEIFFTSSGTEANNFCLKGFAFAHQAKGRHLITSKIEHSSVLETFAFLEKKGFSVTYLDVDSEGFVDPNSLREQIRNETILISIGHVNSEIGTIQPLEALLEAAQGVAFHADVVQSFLKTDFNVQKYPVSLASFSGHKFHAPKGIGFIYKKKDVQLEPQIQGGHQETGLRAGTENTPYIIAMGKVIQNTHVDNLNTMRELQYALFLELKDRFGARINGPTDLLKRVCTNVNISFASQEGETLLKLLSDAKIYVSTGSACSSKQSRISHVLKAIGCPLDYIHGNIRIGLSKYTTRNEIQQFLKSLSDILANQHLFAVSAC